MGNTIFFPPPYCCVYSIILMGILEKCKAENLETYYFPWILWISSGASRFPVNNDLCFNNKVFIVVQCVVSCWLYHLRVRVRDFWPCESLTTDVASYLFINCYPLPDYAATIEDNEHEILAKAILSRNH